MQERRTEPETIFIIHCSGTSYLARLTSASANELSKQEHISSTHEVNNIEKSMAGAGKCIAVDGCEKRCIKKILQNLNCTPEFHLSLSDLGIEERQESHCRPEDLELSKDAIIAHCTRISKARPALHGCC